jgi:nucleoside-diphosphate-sugar epimerase
MAALGARVTIVDAMLAHSGANRANLRSLPSAAEVEVIEADVCAMNDFDRRLGAADVVIDAMGTTGHQWAYLHPDLDLAANVTSHLAVLRAAAAASTRPRLVHLSTRAVYGRAQTKAIDETHPTQPIDIQGGHKLLAERHIGWLSDRIGLRTTILRIGNCYGPGQRLSGDDVGLIGGFFRDIMLGRKAVVYGGSGRHRDFLFADDLADAVLAAGVDTTPGGRVFNIAGASERVIAVAEQTVAAAKRGGVELAPFPDDVARMDPGDLVLDCTLAEQVLRWRPKTLLAAGLRQTADYYATYAQDYGLVE